MRDNSSHIVIIFLLTLITLNLFLLDLKVFAPENNIKISDITSVATPIPSSVTNNLPARNASGIADAGGQPTTNNYLCPTSCLSIIQQATSAAASQGSLQEVLLQKASGQAREFYIPLGSGSTSKSEWEDLLSTDTIIDPANYGNIKETYFIATLRNPTQNGQIEAQLFNVTDKHLVWGSHVVMNGPAVQTVTSDKITLDKGSKLYRVQLKSTLQYAASLENAKIRIISQ